MDDLKQGIDLGCQLSIEAFGLHRRHVLDALAAHHVDLSYPSLQDTTD